MIRSLGGWSTVRSLRRHGDRAVSDERIVGAGDFVEQILKEADELVKRQVPGTSQKDIAATIIHEICNEREVNIKELHPGSRRRFVAEARRMIACRLVKEYGIPLSGVARHVGVSPSAVSKMIGGEEK